jgi:hypothetical protein
MICYALRINPIGHRADVVAHFATLPTREGAIAVLIEWMKDKSHPSGRSMLARCIEALEQRGVPKIEPGKDYGRLSWHLPTPPNARIGWIIVEEFELFGLKDLDPRLDSHSDRPLVAADNRTCGDANDAIGHPMWGMASSQPATDPLVQAEADAKARSASAAVLEPPPVGATDEELKKHAMRQRCILVIEHAYEATVASRKLASGILASLLWEISQESRSTPTVGKPKNAGKQKKEGQKEGASA